MLHTYKGGLARVLTIFTR